LDNKVNNDLITFEGETVQRLKDNFHYVVDEHIKDCEAENISVEKSYKGSFNIRLTPDLHRKAAITAKNCGYTLNAFVKKAIERYSMCERSADLAKTVKI